MTVRQVEYALAKTTRGKWEAARRDRMVKSGITDRLDETDWPWIIWMPSPPFALGMSGAAVSRGNGNAENDAHFIASAPQYVRFLLATVKALRRRK